MIRHIVFFRFRAETKSRIDEAQKLIAAMKNQIPQILNLETGQDFVQSPRSHDLALIVDLATREDLGIYGDHPVHAPVKTLMNEICDSIVAVDYEVQS